MSRPIRVLFVEDSEDDVELVLRELRRNGYDPAFGRVETQEAMAKALAEQPWEVIIADYVMPHFSGLAALALVQETGLDLPFIIVSGKIGEDVAVEAMRAGAHDYITKGSLGRLVPAVERELREAAVRHERREIEKQLFRAHRLELAGQIAGQVAHDLKNLLLPLIGYPQLLRRQLPSDHPAVRTCDAMIKSVRQMNALTDDLLTLGRRGLIAQDAVEVNRLVEDTVAQIGEHPDTLEIELELAENLPAITGNSAQLSRVAANLISNAREAMPDGGTLWIRSAYVRTESPIGCYNRIEAGEYVRLEVGDTGCGIPPEIRDQIFDPFFTTKITSRQHGSGLGLSIIQAIVGDHCGYVDLESEVGRGTTFSIYLPVRRMADLESPALPSLT